MADDSPADITAAIVALSALADAGVEVDGELQVDVIFHAAPRREADQYGGTSLISSHEHLGTEGSS